MSRGKTPTALSGAVGGGKPVENTTAEDPKISLQAMVAPWAVMAGAPVPGVGTSVLFHQNPFVPMTWTVGTGVLALSTWVYASSRSKIHRLHSTATMTLAGLWTAAVSAVDEPWKNPVLGGMWLMGGFIVAGTWNVKHLHRNSGRGTQTQQHSSLHEILAKAGAPGARAERVTSGENRVDVDVEVNREQMTAAEAVELAPRLAALAGLRPGAVRALPSSEDAGRLRYTFVPRDALKNPDPYPGPSAVGETLLAPLHVGWYEEGSQLLLNLMPGSGSNIVHVLIMGVTGSGKTSGGARSMLAEIFTRSETIVWGVDTQKSGQGLGAAEEGFDWLITEDADAEELFDCLPNLVKERTRKLAEAGFDGWRPGCGMPALVLHVEEGSPLLRDNEKFVDFANAARSAGIVIIISLQRPTSDNMPVSLRTALGNKWAFRLDTDDDAKRFLGDEVVESGAHPENIPEDGFGRNYLVGAGIAPQQRVTPAVTFEYFANPEHGAARFAAHVRKYAYLRSTADETTYNAAPEAYRTYRAKRVAAAEAADRTPALSAPAPAPAPAIALEHSMSTDPEFAKLSAAERKAITDAAPQLETDEPELLALLLANPDAELPETPADLAGEVVVTEYDRMTKSEAEAYAVEALGEAWDQNVRKIGTGELFVNVYEATGNGKAWMHRHLRELEDAGFVRSRERGVWELLRRPEMEPAPA